MDKNLGLILIFGLSVLGPSMVFAFASAASITALGRNPSAAPRIFIALIVTLLFAESLALISMLITFQAFTPQGV